MINLESLRGCSVMCIVFCGFAQSKATTFNAPPDMVPSALLHGDVLNIFDGAMLPLSIDGAAGSTINAYGGTHTSAFYTSGEFNLYDGSDLWVNASSPLSIMNIYGGSLGGSSSASNGVVVNVYGGEVGFSFLLFESVLNVFDGVVDDGLDAALGEVNIFGGSVGSPQGFAASTMKIFGGSLPNGVWLQSGSVLLARGGTFGEPFRINEEAEVHLVGLEFRVDGEPVAGLLPGQSLIVDQRDVVLSARLLDGSLVELDLNSDAATGPSWFSADAILRLTLVPEPDSLLLATIFICFATSQVRPRRLRST